MNTYKISKFNCSASSQFGVTLEDKQSGVSLIEVLVALFILVFGSLAIINLQTASSISVATSADHFKINELGHSMIEQLKADSDRALAGEYNTVYEDEGAPSSAEADIALLITEWKTVIARSIPLGQLEIECDDAECNVGLQWYESSYEAEPNQIYNIKTPI